MHDHHAVEALIDRLTRMDLEDVTEIRVRVGMAFWPEALQQAYEMLTRDTPLEGSRLVVVSVPEVRSCSACGRSWEITREDVAGHVVLCPSCGAASPGGQGVGIEVVVASPRSARERSSAGSPRTLPPGRGNRARARAGPRQGRTLPPGGAGRPTPGPRAGHRMAAASCGGRS